MLPVTTDAWKLILGFTIIFVLFILALVIAIMHVEQQTSYGLLPVITALATLGGGFAQWAFRSDSKEISNEKKITD